jgi:DNA uptake protein ComE-like DNA-binding protein
MTVENRNVRTNVETTYRVVGIEGVEAQTEAYAAWGEQIQDVLEKLSRLSHATQGGFAALRQSAAQQGVFLPKQTKELAEKIVIQRADPRAGIEEQAIHLKALVSERTAAEVKKATASLLKTRSFYSSIGDAALGLDPLTGSNIFVPGSKGYQKIQQLQQEARSGDAYRVADAAAPLEFFQRNRFKFTRAVSGLGGKALRGASARIDSSLQAGRLEEAAAQYDLAAERDRIDNEFYRNRNAIQAREMDVRGARVGLGAFEQRLSALRATGVQESALSKALGFYAPALKEVESFESGAATDSFSKSFVKNQLQQATEALKPVEEIAEIFKKTGDGLKDLERRLATLGKAVDVTSASTIRSQMVQARGLMPSAPMRGRAVSLMGVNINAASAAELQRIAGVTPELAAQIVATRTAEGGFSDQKSFLDKFFPKGPSRSEIDAALSLVAKVPDPELRRKIEEPVPPVPIDDTYKPGTYFPKNLRVSGDLKEQLIANLLRYRGFSSEEELLASVGQKTPQGRDISFLSDPKNVGLQTTSPANLVTAIAALRDPAVQISQTDLMEMGNLHGSGLFRKGGPSAVSDFVKGLLFSHSAVMGVPGPSDEEWARSLWTKSKVLEGPPATHFLGSGGLSALNTAPIAGGTLLGSGAAHSITDLGQDFHVAALEVVNKPWSQRNEAKYAAQADYKAAKAAQQAKLEELREAREKEVEDRASALETLAEARSSEEREAGIGSITDMDDAAAKSAASEQLLAEQENRVQEQIAKLNQSSKDMKATARREQLEKRFKYSPKGRAVVARMLEAETAMEGAIGSGATLEAGLRQAEMLNAQAELETIERAQNRGRYQRLGTIRAVSHLTSGLTSAATSAVSQDVRGLGGSMLSIPQAGFGMMRDLAIPHLVTNGLTLGAGAAFGAGLLGAGALVVGQAAYSRGSSFLDTGADVLNSTLPQFEGLFAKYPGLASTNDPMLNAMGYLSANKHREDAGLARELLSQGGSEAEALRLAEEGADKYAGYDQSAAYVRAGKMVRTAFSAEAKAGYAESARRSLLDRIHFEYGATGTTFQGNVTGTDVAAALGATGGRGVGAEFTEYHAAQKRGLPRTSAAYLDSYFAPQLPSSLANVADVVGYANRIGMSATAVAGLSSAGPRFGAKVDTINTIGLMGASGFGFSAGGRDSFAESVSAELMRAGMSGASPEMAQRNRLYQGAVVRGGNQERMAEGYLRSINSMDSRRRGMFAGAAGFAENLQLIKALREGGSLEAADDLLRKQGPGYTEMDKIQGASKYNTIFGMQLRGEGYTTEDIDALLGSAASGGATPLQDRAALETGVGKATEAGKQEAQTELAAGATEQADMGAVALSFDKSTAAFAAAVRRFSLSILM